MSQQSAFWYDVPLSGGGSNMRIIALAGFLGLVTGCVTPISDMMNNQYMNHQVEPVPSNIIGTWTGVAGPYLITLRLMEDGMGTLCNSYGATNYMQSVKHSAGTLYVQDGARLAIRAQDRSLIADSPYTGSKPISFKRDSDMAMAAPYCQKNL